MKAETVPIDSISQDPANLRKHGQRNLDAIRSSLRKFGQQTPIVVSADGVILAGNGRYEAAKALGWPKIDIVRSKLKGSEALAYAIADNRTAELAEWDEVPLAETLRALQSEDFEIEAAGFTGDEIDALIEKLGNEAIGATASEVVEDEVPEPPVDPITKPGDLWILGNHRLLCGDSTKAEDVARLMGGAKAEIMVTDPPYGVEYDADWRNHAFRADGSPIAGRAIGKVTNDDRADWRESWAHFDGGIAYIWHAGCRSPEVAESLDSCSFERRALIVWAKNCMVIGRGDYHHQHEPCWYAVRKGFSGLRTDDRTQTTLWQIDKPKKSETGHSTQKPVECMARPLQNHKVHVVYDPFLGSGTTLIAAEQLGRKCYGMEISPQYCDVIVKRWENLTGQVAVRE